MASEIDKKTANKVEEILTEELPAIKIQLSEVALETRVMSGKIDNIDGLLRDHIQQSSKNYEVLTAHEYKLASLESTNAREAEAKLMLKGWFAKVSAGVVVAILTFFVTKYLLK